MEHIGLLQHKTSRSGDVAVILHIGLQTSPIEYRDMRWRGRDQTTERRREHTSCAHALTQRLRPAGDEEQESVFGWLDIVHTVRLRVEHIHKT